MKRATVSEKQRAVELLVALGELSSDNHIEGSSIERYSQVA